MPIEHVLMRRGVDFRDIAGNVLEMLTMPLLHEKGVRAGMSVAADEHVAEACKQIGEAAERGAVVIVALPPGSAAWS